MSLPTEGEVLAKYTDAVAAIQADGDLVSKSEDAGLYIVSGSEEGGDRVGYKVFVNIHKYSDVQLAADPDGGGLHPES